MFLQQPLLADRGYKETKKKNLLGMISVALGKLKHR